MRRNEIMAEAYHYRIIMRIWKKKKGMIRFRYRKGDIFDTEHGIVEEEINSFKISIRRPE
jgi:hypothetical protein